MDNNLSAKADPSREDLAAMLDESLGESTRFEGKVVTGEVIGNEKHNAILDIGLKSEGLVNNREFAAPGQAPERKVSDKVEVYLERIENANVEAVLARE